MSLDFAAFYELLLRVYREGHLPAFLIGGLAGMILTLIVLRTVRGKGSGLVGFLRSQIEQLTREIQGLESENRERNQRAQALETECGLLRDRASHQDGQIAALREQATELSTDCDRIITDRFETRLELKKERKTRREFELLAAAYAKQLDEINNSDGKIWLRPTSGDPIPFLPLHSRKAAIISLMNLKGGVGKTTVAVNLGAALASEGLRVLIIDLDHQASLTNICLTETERKEVERSHRYVDEFFSEGGDLTAFNRCITRLQTQTGSGQLYLAAGREEFSNVENRLMTRWHAGLTPNEDVRLRLRAALHSSALRDYYDIVLIDCPPRLTTGSINALACSDFVIIPVLLEDASAEAVPRMLTWIRRFQSIYSGDLNVLGIVGNKAYPREKLIKREFDVWNALREKSQTAWGSPVNFFEEVIREHTSISGRFAALDPRHQDRYLRLVNQIRREIPHARLQSATVPPLAGAAAGSGGH